MGRPLLYEAGTEAAGWGLVRIYLAGEKQAGGGGNGAMVRGERGGSGEKPGISSPTPPAGLNPAGPR